MTVNRTSNGSILPASENLFLVCGEGLVFIGRAQVAGLIHHLGRRYPP